MKISLYQVDAFTAKLFGGNPAAVCPLTEWLPDDVMQNIALENNLSETAFFVPKGEAFDIRWFTPKIEIHLAGHPTLATAHVIFHHLDYKKDRIQFASRGGNLSATRRGDTIWLDFPARPAIPSDLPEELISGLGQTPQDVLRGRDYMAVFETEDEILALQPDFAQLAKVECLGIIVTAPGKECDFVSRFFAPRAGINEDPVTGSAHTLLIPYWAERLSKNVMRAAQLSARRGEIFCENAGERVHIGGRAVTFLQGTLEI